MRAVVRDSYGAADVLRVAEIARPAPAAGEVLVQVEAAGLDRGAWHLMTGKPYLLRLVFGVRRPRNPVLGRELAGRVVGVGEGVTKFAEGDEVFGIGEGTFAEYAVARVGKLATKPASLSFAQAAACGISGTTALQALRDGGRIQAGQKVLITGASGGVGSFAVQLAKAFGAEVTGTASTAKLGLVKSLGADHVLDYTNEDFADGTVHYDLIIDLAGNPTLKRLRRALTKTGTAVIAGGEGGGPIAGGTDRQLRARLLSPFVRQRMTSLLARETATDLEVLKELIEAGQVVPSIDSIVPLTGAPQALCDLEDGLVGGKITVTVS
ncbi:NAD(P)-dependent alcohol dehydrogenase [Streptomyces sp. SID13031]|nr:NAD(P)-dependent alcohol dehydrogenase [Streptomyces sp. SID13031]NEA35923.1 NAD(P)-dependent alcohol dehydrogenase [Streptomyces sp. SID13031]